MKSFFNKIADLKVRYRVYFVVAGTEVDLITNRMVDPVVNATPAEL